MPLILKRSLVPAAVLLAVGGAVAVAYMLESRPPAHVSPVQALEAIVEPYRLKYFWAPNVQGEIVADSESLEIHAMRTTSEIEFDSKHMSISGFTAWSVGVQGWNPDLQIALLRAFNHSPASARQIVEHQDERIQLLALKSLRDWGLNTKGFTAGGPSLRTLSPHAIDALLAFADRSDPHTVGTVIASLQFKRRFSANVFRAGMAHSSTNIRAETLRLLDRTVQTLTSAEVHSTAAILIEHLTDRDLGIQYRSMLGLRSLVAYWENSLGGEAIDTVRLQPANVSQLPVPPALPRFEENGVIWSGFSEEYQADWRAWLERAKQTPDTAIQSGPRSQI